MPWIGVTLDVDPSAAEALSEALLEAGAHSVSMDNLDEKRHRLSALLAPDTDAAVILAAAARTACVGPLPAYETVRIEDEDWVRSSQAQFTPTRIGARLWIGPTWCTPPGDAAAVVRLDPGLAFGTGTHPTTRLVLHFLEERVHGGEHVLDYGCGSGRLAIAAAKLGASQVAAVDVDPDALHTTAANALANAVALRIAAPEALTPSQFDLVVSNILAQPLVLLAPLLAARTASGGRIALAGVLETQAAEVALAYAPWFEAAVTRNESGWALIEGVRK